MWAIIDFPQKKPEALPQISDRISREITDIPNEGKLLIEELLISAREWLEKLNKGESEFKPYVRVVPKSLQNRNLSWIILNQTQEVSYLAMEALQNNQLHEFDPERRILIYKYVLLNGFKIGTWEYDTCFKMITNNPDWDISELKRAIIGLKYEQNGFNEV